VVGKELCYGKAETLEDVEEAARWWRYNLVKIKEVVRGVATSDDVAWLLR